MTEMQCEGTFLVSSRPLIHLPLLISSFLPFLSHLKHNVLTCMIWCQYKPRYLLTFPFLAIRLSSFLFLCCFFFSLRVNPLSKTFFFCDFLHRYKVDMQIIKHVVFTRGPECAKKNISTSQAFLTISRIFVLNLASFSFASCACLD